jgi:hypothetical protein
MPNATAMQEEAAMQEAASLVRRGDLSAELWWRCDRLTDTAERD